jgi:S-formylglutathione hydrolase FrmB
MVKPVPLIALAAWALVLGACGSSPPAGTSTSPSAAAACSAPIKPGGPVYEMASCQIPAPSLAGNLLGDPAELEAVVITPHDYATSAKKYPAVYILAGYTDSGASIAEDIVAAPAPAMDAVVVVVSGVNSFGGSFYVNSSVTGAWEDAIVKDLVSYVDAHYRTVPAASARGIAGHSMGGFGALNLAMRHPDVFGATYALSPGLFDRDGAAMRLGDPATADRVLDVAEDLTGLAPEQAVDQLQEQLSGEDLQFEWAYGTAFAPDPTSPALMRIPFTRNGTAVQRDAAIWSAWEAGFGALPAKIDQYGQNLRSLRAIGLDYGTRDEYRWIPPGCAYFADLLHKAGIKVTVATFDGGHGDQLADRLVAHMLPFMASTLQSS